MKPRTHTYTHIYNEANEHIYTIDACIGLDSALCVHVIVKCRRASPPHRIYIHKNIMYTEATLPLTMLNNKLNEFRVKPIPNWRHNEVIPDNK